MSFALFLRRLHAVRFARLLIPAFARDPDSVAKLAWVLAAEADAFPESAEVVLDLLERFFDDQVDKGLPGRLADVHSESSTHGSCLA